jgi:pimeloyl-ACP methyl ester carboxylesterase
MVICNRNSYWLTGRVCGLMRIWAAHLRNHEWVVIHDAGHAMTRQHPGGVNDIALDFFRRH